MKQFQRLALAAGTLFCLVALAGCQSGSSGSATNSSASSNETTTSSAPSPSEAATAQNETNPSDESKDGSMIIYFSGTGHTREVASKLQEETGISLYQIKAAQEYTSDDLNYHNDDCRANQEQNDDAARPAIDGDLPDLSSVDTIYLGFPLWWGKPARIIQTFIEQANLAGKTVHVFCTSGSSPMEPAFSLLKANYPDVNWQGSRRFEIGASNGDIAAWASSLTQ